MYNHEPTGYVCPLCLIAKDMPTDLGDQRQDVVFRTEHATAYIAGKWWRAAPAHVIVIPNKHFENLYDLPDEVAHDIADLSKKIVIALKDVYRCGGTSTRQHNEPAGNQGVWHYHLHVFPRSENDDLYKRHDDTYWPEAAERKPFADRLKAYFEDT